MESHGRSFRQAVGENARRIREEGDARQDDVAVQARALGLSWTRSKLAALERGDKAIDLTSREYALLEVFMQNPGRILTRTLICEKIWESHYDVDTNLLDVYMSKLRSKLETTPGKAVFKTIRGVGYQLL